MNSAGIIICHGGYWRNNAYENGVEDFLRIPPDGMTFQKMRTQIESIVGVDGSPYECSVYGMVDSPRGGKVRMKIKDDDDLNYMMGLSSTLIVFVTLTPRITCHPVQNNFLNLLNAQNTQTPPYSNQPTNPYIFPPLVGHMSNVVPEFPPFSQHNSSVVPTLGVDDFAQTKNAVSENEIYIDKHNDDWVPNDDSDDEEDEDSLDDDDDDVDDDDRGNDGGGGGGYDDRFSKVNHHSVSNIGTSSDHDDVHDDAWQETVTRGKQWVIPGAQYQTYIPIEQTEVIEATRDTLCVGATFMSKDSMRTTLGLYHLHNRVEYEVDRSDTKRFTAVCKHNDECQFLMTATARGSLWRVIKWVAPHSCHMDFSRRGPRIAPAQVIAAYFAPNLMSEGVVLRPREMQSHLQRQFGVVISYGLALEARNQAITMIYGDSDKSFNLLPSYLYMVQQSNAGSFVDLQTDIEDRFQYAYMALSASVNGFLSCGRPVIVVDGTHLKGKYKGIMFVAATKDGNEQIYPLAFGIGDKENDNSWSWFFRQLKRTFGCPDNLLFISDQHISIKNAIDTVYPGTHHGICAYHLQKKLKKWGKHVIAMYQNAVNSYRSKEFDIHMNNLSVVSDGAYKKLLNADPKRWARSKCGVRRYCFMTSNCAESLNGRLRWARRLPVCTLLECVRSLVSSWFIERRTNALSRTQMLTDYASKKLAKSVEYGLTMSVEAISVTKFKVTNGTKHYVIDLAAKTCSCKEFELDLIPCSHAAAAIRKANQTFHTYVSTYYMTETLVEMYSGEVFPILHPDEWEIPLEIKSKIVGTPINPRQAGRPRTTRISSPSQSSTRQRKCSRCGKIGHYSARCTEHITAEEIGTSQPSVSKTRKPKRCSICHAIGHTRPKCAQRVT